ncbi:MAG: asparaginase domain-containing protein [Patescibacteria group bacterium]
MNPVRLILTGGTIDSAEPYRSDIKSTFPSGTHIPEMLEQARVKSGVVVDVLMLKDSNDITEEDRHLLLERCREMPEERAVVTHGTDTMADTARFLGERIKDKTIVMTGAMTPFVMERSDSLFNLGFAVASAQNLPKGVYVAMNGRIFDWDNVRKNREIGMFEELKS